MADEQAGQFAAQEADQPDSATAHRSAGQNGSGDQSVETENKSVYSPPGASAWLDATIDPRVSEVSNLGG